MENDPGKIERNITISVATLADVEGIQKVFYNTWLNTYPNIEAGVTVDDIKDRFKDRFTEEGLQEAKERISKPPGGSTTFVAKEGNEIVGVCRILVLKKENRIAAIYVLPEHQKKGIGKKFWEQAQKYFDPNKDTFVSVVDYNVNAISFYESLGFEDTGKRWRDEKRRMKSGAIQTEAEMVIKAKNLR
jgi:ribosomal protein S18 acetylase RimI-like enzyme